MNYADWLNRIEYWPGFKFTLYEHDEGPVLSIEFSVPDSRKPGEIQDQLVWTFIPPCETDKQFFRWLKWRLDRIAIHEVGEALVIDGKLPFDPHQPLEYQVAR